MDPITGMLIAQGAGMGLSFINENLMGPWRRKQQIMQQKALNKLALEDSMKMADYGLGLQKELFHATGYGAQRAQMEAAGLNPALMYGHAGGMGATGISASTMPAGHASDEASRAQVEGMAVQRAITIAQVKNLEAQTAKTEAETKAVETDVELKKTNITEITEKIENYKVERQSFLLENRLKELEYEVTKESAPYRLDEIKSNLRIMDEQLTELMRNNEINEEIKNEITEQAKLRTKAIAQDILLTIAKNKLTREQANKIVNDIYLETEALYLDYDIKNRNIKINEISNKLKEKYPTLQQVGGRLVNNTVDVIYGISDWLDGKISFTDIWNTTGSTR